MSLGARSGEKTRPSRSGGTRAHDAACGLDQMLFRSKPWLNSREWENLALYL
jgi:hypothetical protein